MRSWCIGHWALILLLPLSGGAIAHTGEKLVPVQLVVAKWAVAYQSDDMESMAELLVDNFNGSAAAREAYLARMPLLPVKQVLLKYANYQISGNQAQVSQIVHVPYREINTPFALKMELEKRGERWQITAIVPEHELPEELQTHTHPLQHITHGVRVSLRDQDTGGPIHARVHVRDHQGEYWPPQGHRTTIAKGWREDIGGDVIVDGKTFAYVNPDFVLPLPPGRYLMEIERGPEYVPHAQAFAVTEEEIPELAVKLKRWIHMAERGWYSGDTHTHFLDPQTAMLEAQGEDLNVINVLASSGGNLITSVHHFTGSPSIFSDDENIVYIAEETRHDYLGHTVLLNLKELVFPFGWGGPNTGVHGGYDFPTMAHQADKAREKGALVAWAHLPHPHAELPIDASLGKVDAVETMVFGDPMAKRARVYFDEFPPENLSPIDLWYSLLNTGHDLPGLGSTDKMWNSQVSGSVRTYVLVDGKFNYQSWIDGIEAGRTFFTSGPMLSFSLGGHKIGDQVVIERSEKFAFTVEVESRLPVDRIDIVVNGEVLASKENTERQQKVGFKGDLTIDNSAWVSARAYSSQILPTQAHLTGSGSPVFAHTSPVYVSVDNQPRASAESAAYLLNICDKTIEWAKTRGRYHDEAQRQEVVSLYETACAKFR